jgi:hypothetical protein
MEKNNRACKVLLQNILIVVGALIKREGSIKKDRG